jgi:hypothetical protein
MKRNNYLWFPIMLGILLLLGSASTALADNSRHNDDPSAWIGGVVLSLIFGACAGNNKKQQ